MTWEFLSFGLNGCLQPSQRSPKTAMKLLTTFEAFCLKNAAHFVAARGRTPRDRTQQQFATLREAQAFGAAISDDRNMIYAVTQSGQEHPAVHA